MIHELKCNPEYFREIFTRNKNFEVRNNDRNYQVGDILILREYEPKNLEYTGAETKRRVTYILPVGLFGIEKGFVVMSIE